MALPAAAPGSHACVCLGRALHCRTWGPADGEVVLAWHGLARSGRDFDAIACHLGQRWRVVCPDLPGCGRSPCASAPDAVALAGALLDSLGAGHCHWLGTGQGGTLGLQAAAGALRGRIGRLVLNDAGPGLPAAGVAPGDGGDAWAAWDRLSLPVLVLRRASSTLLPLAVADAMRTRGRRAVVATIPGCGPTPDLDTPAEWALVERFLAG